jgi:hypothetical protein
MLDPSRPRFARFRQDGRGRRVIEIDPVGHMQKPWIPADCHLNGRPYIEPDAAAHP